MNFKQDPLSLVRSLECSSRCGDVSLVCRDGSVSSHSLLLAAVSPSLREAILGCPRDMEMFTVMTPWCSVKEMTIALGTLVGRAAKAQGGDLIQMFETLGIVWESDNSETVKFKVEQDGDQLEFSQPDDEEDDFPSYFGLTEPTVKLELSGDSLADQTEMKNYKCDMRQKKVHQQTPAMLKANLAAVEIMKEVDMDGKKMFGCSKCEYTNSLRYKTIRHCYKHTKIYPYQCDLCNEMFRDDRACKEHVTRDHNGLKQYKCEQCNTQLTSKTSLHSHLKRHTIPSDLFKCEEEGCDFSTNLRGTLQKHVERRHTAENKTHLCNSCGKTFFDKVDLARHEESIHVEPHLACRYCPKLYPTERHRTAHEGRVHSTELRFQCDECPMGYRHPSSLQKHILSAHRGEEARKFKCAQCGKGFITNGKLMAHERIHSGEKRYGCPYCGLRFTDSSAMSRHRKIHEGGSKYTCDVCGKTYSQSYDVVKHKTAVHGVVPAKQWEHHYKGDTKDYSKEENFPEKEQYVINLLSTEPVDSIS